YGKCPLLLREAVIPFPRRPSGAASREGSPMAKSVYDEVYARSMKDPEGFWARAAEDIHWEKRWDRVFDDSRKPFSRCFTGAALPWPSAGARAARAANASATLSAGSSSRPRAASR